VLNQGHGRPVPLSAETKLLRALALILLAVWIVGVIAKVGEEVIHFLLVMAGLMYILGWISRGSSGAG